MIPIIPIKAFTDNYIWLGVNQTNKLAFVVDPGDATPILHYLKQKNLSLTHILLTHHHDDHTGGVAQLREHIPQLKVYAPKHDGIEAQYLLEEPDKVELADFGLTLKVMDVPGHTRGHIAYFCQQAQSSLLFCGDTLFSAGCGRLFEGTPQQMLHSLKKLACLPGHTQVYCTHEYTQANLKFALSIEPTNPHLLARIKQVEQLRQQGQPSLPSTLADELRFNPFLRCHLAEVQQAVAQQKKPTLGLASVTLSEQTSKQDSDRELATFTQLRLLKDSF